eukprot:5698382-Amphidinium_carterae.1
MIDTLAHMDTNLTLEVDVKRLENKSLTRNTSRALVGLLSRSIQNSIHARRPHAPKILLILNVVPTTKSRPA